MKSLLTKTLVAVTFPLAATVVFADDITPEPAAVPSTLTRAQVLAETAQARAAGEIVSGEQTFVAKVPAASNLSRETVRAEAIAAAKTKKNQYHFENDQPDFRPANTAE
jgi:hypothetical protein